MRPSPGDRICGHVQIDEDASADLGGHAWGPTLVATLGDQDDAKVWLTVVERPLVPAQVDVSAFMAHMGGFLSLEAPVLAPVRLVDREADFCVVGYDVLPDAVPLRRRIEGAGSTAGLVARVAVEVARGLAHLHAQGRVHGALSPGNVVLWRDGVSLWQYGLAPACPSDALAPLFQTLGGDVVAPEVRAGEASGPTADVYAWGAIVAALATDTVGGAALAAVEDGELSGAGPLAPVVTDALADEASKRPEDGLALLRALANLAVPEEAPRHVATRLSELRALASRYVIEVEGGESEEDDAASSASGRRRLRRTAAELHPPELAPIAGVMVVPDEPEPDPFTVSSAVAPADVVEEEPERVPTPAPMQITARRIEDEPARQFNPDALTPPDGAQIDALESPAESGERVVDLPPLAMDSGLDEGRGPAAPRLTLPERPARESSDLSEASERPRLGAESPPPPEPASEAIPIEMPKTLTPAPIPPPPQHDDMSPEDSGFGLSLPIAESLDARADPAAEAVAGALVAATSSSHLSTVDGERAEANPAFEPDSAPQLELDLPERPAGSGARPRPKPPERPAPVTTAALEEAPPAPSPPLRGARLELDFDGVRKPAGVRRPADSSMNAPVPAVSGTMPVAAGGARGPRGSTMAAVMGFGATILAVGLTVPVAEVRGGLSALLGEQARPVQQAAPPEPESATAAEPDPVSIAPPTSCPDEMVAISAGSRVCIDRGEQPGLRERPKTGLSLREAATACEDLGRRLCTAKEWRSACRGADARRQPYVGAYVEGRCNEALGGVPQNLGRSGARDLCVTPEGVFDLAGNVGEWVAGGQVLGGDATTQAASCASSRRPGVDVREPAIGYRCCVSLADE